ncbi:MAG: hypothetical protein CVV09_15950 [Gammaproteobacteria bacterium HGW-Gammaproteobacteria-13]|nr:MAG: hypothetical protein CVV09_15950 [Gammaproteobacteria bacterium HGW-Gammaproteobacteria-13]
MKKSKKFISTRFTTEVIKNSLARFAETSKVGVEELKLLNLSVGNGNEEWHHDSLEEFLSDYRKYHSDANLLVSHEDKSLSFWTFEDYARVQVECDIRSNIESIFEIFETSAEACKVPEEEHKAQGPTIFIGHGRSPQWRDLKDHLQEKHGYKVEAYETGARAGHTIRDILEDMIAKSSFAVLVLTSEDEQPNGQYRARQNVIHEAGLFQGKLGFPRAVMLLEDGIEEFSNVAGVQYIRFTKNNIKETYGDVLATIRREFMN